MGQRKQGEMKRPLAVMGCKLSIHYEDGEQPMAELLRLAGGQGMPVMVEAVAPGSKADRAGVKSGMALVSMNGRNEFMQLPGWQVRLLLEAPITLGFDPEPEKPQASKCTEIRLTRVQDVLGIPPKVAVCGPKETGVLAEEVIFKQSAAPLWLAAWGEESLGETPDVAAHSPVKRLYELRRPEAHAIVGSAIRGARDTVQPSAVPFEAEWFQSAASRGPRRSVSPSLCTMDCVAECLDDELVFGPDKPPHKAGQKAKASLQQHPLQQQLPPPPSRCRSAEGGGVRWSAPRGCRDDRSPLRWFAPLLDKVWGESPSPPRVGRSPRPAVAASAPHPRPGPGKLRPCSPQPASAKGDEHSSEVDGSPAAVRTRASDVRQARPKVEQSGAPPQPARLGFLSSARSDLI